MMGRAIRQTSLAILGLFLLFGCSESNPNLPDPEAANQLVADAQQAWENQESEVALNLLEQAVTADPEHAEAYYLRALILEDLGQTADSQASLEKSFELQPTLRAEWNRAQVEQAAEIFEQGQRAFQAGQLEESVELYRKALAISRDPQFLGQLAIAEAMAGQFDESVAHFEEIIAGLQAYPGQVAYYEQYAGLTLMLANRPEEAITHFDRAIEADPEAKETHFHRGIAFLRSSQPEHAKEDFDIVLSVQPDDPQALLYRAKAFEQLGQADLSIRDKTRALLIDPNAQLPNLLP